jgi:hypothetical protein
MNKVKVIQNLGELIEHWDLFTTGYQFLTDPKGAGLPLGFEDFRALLISTVVEPQELGAVMLLTSKNDKVLGFAMVQERLTTLKQKVARVLFVYSTGKCPSTEHELFYECKKWAKKFGFSHVDTVAYRVNGAQLRWFQDNFGFESRYLTLVSPVGS